MVLAPADALARLVADGLLEPDPEHGHRATKRWQGALMRAAQSLLAEGEDGEDLRVPIARALVELYGDSMSDAELVGLVSTMLPIATRELFPQPPKR